MQPGWDDDDLAPRARRNPLVAVVAVLLVIALAGGAIVIAFDRTSSDDIRAEREVTFGSDDDDGDGPLVAPDDAPPPSPEKIDAAVAELSKFVAAARELEFKRPVTVKLLPDDEFAARVQEDAVDDLEELDQTARVLRAIGLLDEGVDLAEVLTSFLGDGVVGFYDPESEELVVRGATLTPYVRLTLTHELTHALDDQHFELERPDLDEADDERGFAFSALVEGNAVRVEEEYRETLTEDEREAADDEEARIGEGLDLSAIPSVLPQLIGFPYIYGPPLVEALLEEGGEARVNEAFSAPPATSEQVLDPATWLAGRSEPIPVAPPAADGEVFDQGSLGLWGVVLLLGEELGQGDAVRAAAGWGGDWYVAWVDGDRTCVRNTLVMDDAEELRQLRSALEDWAAGHGGAEVESGDDAVTYTACG